MTNTLENIATAYKKYKCKPNGVKCDKYNKSTSESTKCSEIYCRCSAQVACRCSAVAQYFLSYESAVGFSRCSGGEATRMFNRCIRVISATASISAASCLLISSLLFCVLPHMTGKFKLKYTTNLNYANMQH